MSDRRLVVGTRGSSLALWQAERVSMELQTLHPDLSLVIRTIETRGDLVRDRALSQVGGKGLFVKEIEGALLAGEIDLAVHSLKDMPTEQPEGLALGAILQRADPRDALVARASGDVDLSALPKGARLGTSSLRRKAQALASRSDLQVADLRGNVDTRLRKLSEGQYDAIVLAVAGLARLGRADSISSILPADVMLPAVGQGALCIEVRAADERTSRLIAPLDHIPTRRATGAERAFLRSLEGGCQVPIGALAQADGAQVHLRGLVAALDGSRVLRDDIHGPAEQAEAVGKELAERLLAAGGDEILEEVRRAS